MAIAIKSVTTATNNGGSATVSVTTSESPSATASGDLVVVFYGNNYYALSAMGTPSATGSPTMNAIVTADGGATSGHVKAYWYVANTAGAQTIQATETGSADEEKYITAYVLSGADTTTPTDGSASNFSATATASHVAPAVSPATSNAFVIAIASSGGGSATASYTTPAPLTEDGELRVGGISGVYGSAQLAASGDTGTFTFTPANSIPFAAVTVAIETASGGGTTYQLTATGTGTSTGSAAITIVSGATTYQLTAAGTGTTSGAVALSLRAAVSASGTGQSAGSAALSLRGALSASGTAQSGGSAALTIIPASTVYQLTASGASTTTGLAILVLLEPSYSFSPPSHEEPIRTSLAPLRYYRLTYANSIVRINGVLMGVRHPSTDLLTEAGSEGVDWFLGGREYVIPRSVAEELIAGGYEPDPFDFEPLTTTYQITASGNTTTSGSVAMTIVPAGPVTYQLTASGSGTTGGSVALTVAPRTYQLTAAGTGTTSGSAAITIPGSQLAPGVRASAGTVGYIGDPADLTVLNYGDSFVGTVFEGTATSWSDGEVLNIRGDNLVVDGFQFNDVLVLHASGVNLTIRNCVVYVPSGAFFGISTNSTSQGTLTVEDTSLICTKGPGTTRVGVGITHDGRAIYRRVDVDGAGDSLHACGYQGTDYASGTIISQCYVHNGAFLDPEQHADFIQIFNGMSNYPTGQTYLTIEHCASDISTAPDGTPYSACITMGYPNSSTVEPWLSAKIDNNLIPNGLAHLRIQYGQNNTTVTNNDFGFRNPGEVSCTGTEAVVVTNGLTWTNNVDGNGNPIDYDDIGPDAP